MAVVLPALLLIGCPLALTPEGAPISPGVACTPTVAGVVTEVDAKADGTLYSLADGSSVVVPVNTRLFGTEPTPGDLLLYGESVECGAFRGRASPTELTGFGACLVIYESAIDDDNFVLFRDGLRVPKADGFVTQPRYVSGVACLNESGEIVYYSD